MTWIHVLTIIAANIGWCTTMFFWLRKESNADRKELSASIGRMRELLFIEGKDFHARIKVLENNGE